MRKVYEPRPYQLLMRELMMSRPRCNIFARMGMGKTVEALTGIDMLNAIDGTQRTIVFAPKRVALSVWPREAEKWGHLRDIKVMPIIGTAEDRAKALHQDANVWTINYDNIPWLVEHFKANGKPWPFTRAIADESTRLKNFRLRGQGGTRATAIASVAFEPIKWWVNLTGTPAPNGLKDLWGQQWFVDGGRRLGRTFTAFKERWFQPAWNGYGVEPQKHAQAEIQELLKDVSVALDPKDWFDLADPVMNDVYVELPPRARRKYREMEVLMYTELERDARTHGIEAVNAAARTVKCLQLANGAAYIERGNNEEWAEVHSAKLEALDSIVTEANGAPVLVSYQWNSDAARIMKAYPKARLLDDKKQTEDDWNDGKIPMLLAHPASAGHGLNLQRGGNIIVYFGLWWDLELYEQILERIGPMRQLQEGLDRNVFVYRIVARDTVDEDVLTRLATKASVQDILIASQKRRRLV